MTIDEFVKQSGEGGQAKIARGWAVVPAKLDGGECDYEDCEGWHWVMIDTMREMVEIGMRSKDVLQWLQATSISHYGTGSG